MLKRDFTERELNDLEAKNGAFWSKLDSESDLGVVLSAGAFFENKLSKCLKYYFAFEPVAEKLPGPRGPLGTFMARVDCARCLRIVDERHHRCLTKLARVRNRFAHHLDASFEQSPINDQVNDYMKSYFSETLLNDIKSRDGMRSGRKRFEFTSFCIGMDLSHREIDVWMHTRSYGGLIPDHLDQQIKKEGK